LQNQQTGVQGAAQLGNVTQQGINAAMNVGKEQQNAPFTNVGNLASLLGTIKAPTTESTQKQMSPLGQITTLGNAVLGAGRGLDAFGKTELGQNIYKKLGLGSLVGGGGSGLTAALNPGTYNLADGGKMVINANGYRMITTADGTVLVTDANGNPVSAQDQYEAQGLENPGSGGLTGGGGDTGGDYYDETDYGGGDYVGPDYGTNPDFDNSWYDTNSYD
jgi:hypothetical protein